ncbi:hypothetical protein FN846DRAFT_41574 [Sphaerosporella brunnea]|uniref:Uncharacterized protein n=1 Tax=Sphaerosporella brunnea TaxID=1250544 RepID=A0A5J5F9U8_9PEZI|nr:hypothetical protein FN846DRAFT_41574 [Sphaerosporella brunnea]
MVRTSEQGEAIALGIAMLCQSPHGTPAAGRAPANIATRLGVVHVVGLHDVHLVVGDRRGAILVPDIYAVPFAAGHPVGVAAGVARECSLGGAGSHHLRRRCRSHFHARRDRRGRGRGRRRRGERPGARLRRARHRSGAVHGVAAHGVFQAAVITFLRRSRSGLDGFAAAERGGGPHGRGARVRRHRGGGRCRRRRGGCGLGEHESSCGRARLRRAGHRPGPGPVFHPRPPVIRAVFLPATVPEELAAALFDWWMSTE